MSPERDDEKVRELRLEGPFLLVAGGVLLAALIGAFFFGRWYERQLRPAALLARDAGDPLANVAAVEEAPADVDESAGYFDRLQGDEQALEPGREVGAATPATPAAPPPQRVAPPPAAGGSYFVQVFAGRDEAAAAGLVQTLEAAGYAVKLHTEREGQGALYKVRVGGYATPEQAREAARHLQREGYAGAWVTQMR